MQEFTLNEITERAQQVEIICRLLEVYPSKLNDGDIPALAGLLAKLSGSVALWLIDERFKRYEQ
ncbi:hypothetical protein ABMD60_000363 [Escherichia coli]|nr:hypothetical protein [Escherichia coli]